jgi:YggT family protein
MDNALVFIVSTLTNLYVMTFVIRILLQWQRPDFRNPVVQFVFTVTNPLVLPLRRYIPPAYGLDTSSLLVAIALKAAEFGLLLSLLCTTAPGLTAVAGMTVLSLLRTVLNLYFFLILISVILSWIASNGYNPAAQLVGKLAEPVLRPFRKLIPPIGGIDLSPMLAIIVIQALTMLIPQSTFFVGLGCPPAVGMI